VGDPALANTTDVASNGLDRFVDTYTRGNQII
jgi:hypothetical protein